jgi:hypothetical protein
VSTDQREMVFDQYTPISFKRHFGSRKQIGEGVGFKPPDWIGPEHFRRLQAYAILRAYQDNAGREFFAGSRTEINDRREYGDAALLVETVVNALLGEDQQIVTEGAEELALEEPDEQEKLDANGDPVPPPEPDPEEEARRREAEAAMDLQEFLRQWATDERLGLKMIETERLAVGLGDGVYSLGWSSAKHRPRLRVWDPAFYYPVLTDANEDDYPDRVHIAWEVEDDDTRRTSSTRVKVRRITWELGAIEPAEREGTVRRLLGSGDQLFSGDSRNDDGQIQRTYPWNNEPSAVTCYYTDATWTVDKQNRTIDDLTEAEAVYATDEDGQPIKRRDLHIDFVPVIHMPNTVALLNHYGRSLIATVLQILDDLSSADTDLSAASATTGHPILALSGATVARDQNGRSTLSYRPGEILETGDGKMDVLDTSRALAALMDYIEFLLKRLSTNSRVSEALLGRIKPSEVPSGVALQLGFGPTDALVRGMRLVRAEKYPLMLKFAHRMFLAAQAAGEDVGEVPAKWIHTEVAMGNFLPQDQAAAVTQVTALYHAKAISIETAIRMLINAGLPIESVLEEIERIQERDFEAANALLDATGDKSAVAEFLGLPEPPPDPEPEPVVVAPSGVPVPPVPGQPPVPNGNQPPQPVA